MYGLSNQSPPWCVYVCDALTANKSFMNSNVDASEEVTVEALTRWSSWKIKVLSFGISCTQSGYRQNTNFVDFTWLLHFSLFQCFWIKLFPIFYESHNQFGSLTEINVTTQCIRPVIFVCNVFNTFIFHQLCAAT